MIFISSTDTNVGKTYFSSQLIKTLIEEGLLKANQIAYYKPIQCGTEIINNCDESDFSLVGKNNPNIKVFNSYFFKCPASPNYAAEIENTEVAMQKIIDDFNQIKKQFDFVVVEGAGGLAVPINNQELISDLAKALNLPLILVIRPDLGTINHSLLSIEHARNKELNIVGVHVNHKCHPEEVRHSEAETDDRKDPMANNLRSLRLFEAQDDKTSRIKHSIDTILKMGKVELFDINKFIDVIASEAKQSL